MDQKSLLLMKKSLNRARKVENQSLQEKQRPPKGKISLPILLMMDGRTKAWQPKRKPVLLLLPTTKNSLP
jgi:hypothetical protein